MGKNETIFRERNLRMGDRWTNESHTPPSRSNWSEWLEPCPLNRAELSAMVAEVMD